MRFRALRREGRAAALDKKATRRGRARPAAARRVHRLLPAGLRRKPEAARGDRRRRAGDAAQGRAAAEPRRGLSAAGMDPARLRRLRRAPVHAARRAASTSWSGCGARPRASRWRCERAAETASPASSPRSAAMQAVLEDVARLRRYAQPGADPRRERHRQGPDRAPAALRLRAARRPADPGPLPLDPRGAARVRAVRPREGRLHRRAEGQARQDRAGRAAARSTSTRSTTCSPKLQAKLLRVVEEQRFERLGGTRTLEVDVRVWPRRAWTCAQAVQSGSFREDLYHRLSVVPAAAAPAARAARGHPAAGRALPGRERERGATAARAFARGRARGAARLPVARQRARAARGRRARRRSRRATARSR